MAEPHKGFIFKTKQKHHYSADGKKNTYWVVRMSMTPNGPHWESEKRYKSKGTCARAVKQIRLDMQGWD